MAPFGTNYNPSSVMMGKPGEATQGPYMWTGPDRKTPKPFPTSPWNAGQPDVNPGLRGVGAQTTVPAKNPAGNVLGPESIRATGTGPFDAAYRQNLATYAGGQFARPSGGLNFNPTDPSTFPGLPTGGGTAPVTGMPQSLMDMALGGQGFSWTPPPAANTAASPGNFGSLQQWMDQFMRGGRNQRMGSYT